MDNNGLIDFLGKKRENCEILVIGDIMLDKYFYTEVTRISPEAPVPIARVVSDKETLGGAANVAHNLSLLGVKTSIVGLVGNDYHAESLIRKFNSNNIKYKNIVYCDKPTITKARVIGDHQQMLRLDFEDTNDLEDTYIERIIKSVKIEIANQPNCVIISDYGKGVCTEKVCSYIVSECHNYNIPVFVDPKGTNWEKYKYADYITPNLKEANAVTDKNIKNNDCDVAYSAKYIMGKYNISNILLTRSECGLSFINKIEEFHIPTKAQEVYDVSGAGDTVLSVFAFAISLNIEHHKAAYLANLAASVVVAKVGTYAISFEELKNVMSRFLRFNL